jgi:hypothetical protein
VVASGGVAFARVCARVGVGVGEAGGFL